MKECVIKVGIITTIDTNIGDDLIRKGIFNLLEFVLRPYTIEYVIINKHQPYTIFPSYDSVSHFDFLKRVKGGTRLKRIIDRFLYRIPKSHFDDCNLIIQSGAPVIWENCYTCEWNIPIYQKVIGRLHTQIPFLNLAMGSCYPMENIPDRLSNTKDIEFIDSICSYASIMITRDQLANQLIVDRGFQNWLLPCTAFLSGDTISDLAEDGPILINYMQGGGHFDWGQNIDANDWENTVMMIVKYFGQHHAIEFLCHDEKEVNTIQKLFPGYRVIYPKTVNEYFELVKHAKVALCNRMHASVAMASIGIPSIAVGTDTRNHMVDLVGLKTYYVKDASYSKLQVDLEQLLEIRFKERDRLVSLKENTWNQYVDILRNITN